LERYSARQLRSPVITQRRPLMWSLNRSTSHLLLAIGPTAGRGGMAGGVHGCVLEFKYVTSSLTPQPNTLVARRATGGIQETKLAIFVPAWGRMRRPQRYKPM
jgi:hypothetical protein